MINVRMKGVIVRAFSRVFYCSLLVFNLSVLAGAGVVRAGSTTSLADELQALLSSPKTGKMRVGVQIVSLEDKPRLVCEQNANEPFKPASNQKILTTAAAMALLPADFKFTTVLARRGDDLVVIGAGDPATGDPKLARAAGQSITGLFHEWADKLKAAGITHVSGDLLFDDYVFEQQHINPSWAEQFKDQMQNWYVAPVGGLNFNDNCVDVLVKPGPSIGAAAEVTLIPNTAYLKVSNTCKTAGKGEPVIRRTSNGSVTISVSGSVSKASDPNNATNVTVVDPGMFFGSALRTVLAAQGIAIDGETKRQRVRTAQGSIPSGLQIIARHEQTLPDLLERSDKDSQNLFAEALLKAVGAYVGAGENPRVGSYESGRQVIDLFLKKLGLPHEGCVIDDGSGLSHSNRVTPAVLSPRVMQKLEHQLLICYVGERRMAKNILRQIMRRYLARAPEVVRVLYDIKVLARDMKEALEAGALDALGRMMAQHWDLNKQMDQQTSTPHVERLMEAMQGLTYGAKLAGAGGGGFMIIMAREGDAAQKLKEKLTPILAGRGGRFYDFKIDDQGPVSKLESRSSGEG